MNKAKVIKRQSVFDRLGKESPPPLNVTLTKEPEKKTEIKMLKPLKTSVTVQLKVRMLLNDVSHTIFYPENLVFQFKNVVRFLSSPAPKREREESEIQPQKIPY